MALGEFVRQLLCNELSCEVDPLRLGTSPSSAQLERNRQQLLRQVEAAWRCVLGCQDFFPHPLRLLFANLRQRLEQAGRAELADNCEDLESKFCIFIVVPPSLSALLVHFLALSLPRHFVALTVRPGDGIPDGPGGTQFDPDCQVPANAGKLHALWW